MSAGGSWRGLRRRPRPERGPERQPVSRSPLLRGLAILALTAAVACVAAPTQQAEPRAEGLLAGLLQSRPDLFADLLDEADAHRIKIELVVVGEGKGAAGPTLERHAYERGPEYFYPASAVKTAAVIAALEQLADVEAAGWQPGPAAGAPISRSTALRFHPLFDDDVLEETDASHLDGGTITAGHDARKVLLVSDNGAYNRLYELAGNDGVNGSLRAAGLTRTRIFHRLAEFRSSGDQLRVPAIDLLDDQGRVIASLPARTAASPGSNADLDGVEFGRAHTLGAQLVEGPMSFARKNFMPLEELVDMNIMLLRPDLQAALDRLRGGPTRAGFGLSEADRDFVVEAMASTPGASADPRYDPSTYPDDYSKFLLPGLLRIRTAEELLVRDKVGRAYGFSITNSEVVDRRTGRSFFLAATLYTNPNGVVGDGVYDYGRADRFLADLGEVVGRAVLGVEPRP